MDGMIDPVPEWWLAALAVLGVALGAVLTAGETALERITRTAVADLEGRRTDAVRRLVERRALAQGATAFVRVLAEMTAAVCITLVVADLVPQWWQVLLVAIGVTAVLLALVVGASPRTIGRRHPGRVLLLLAPVMLLLAALAGPVVRLGSRFTLAARRTEAEAREEAAEDLRDMVDRVSNSDELEDEEREMLQSVFELGRTFTREVMVPRTDMVTVDAAAPLHKAITLFVRSGFSRVPVVGESTDDLRGVLYLKDALRRAHRRPDADEVTVAEVMREAVFVPETKLVDDLLREMQAESFHIAMVVDEYGGIAGLVTIEDLLEELVGEMTDEHDRAEPEVEQLADGVVRVPARMSIGELGDLFDLEIEDDDVDSVGGLLAKALGKVPLPGSAVEVHGLHLAAERTEGRRRRISTVLVTQLRPPEEDTAVPDESQARA